MVLPVHTGPLSVMFTLVFLFLSFLAPYSLLDDFYMSTDRVSDAMVLSSTFAKSPHLPSAVAASPGASGQ